MHFRNLDVTAGEGQAAVTRLETAHGPALAAVARSFDRLFLLGSPWAPGLWFVGGQRRGFSVGGVGLTLDEALVSAAGEAVERAALVEQPGDIVATGPMTTVGDVTPAMQALLALAGATATPLDWVAGERFEGGSVKLPADWCLRRKTPGPLDMGDAQSTGTAAGATRGDATRRALLELIERDAAALWWAGGRPARHLDITDERFAETRARLQALRRGETARVVRFLDLTTDIGVPVVAVISTAADGAGFCCGMACRLTLAEAASSALLETVQMETALQFAEAKKAELGEAALAAPDRAHLARAALLHADDAPVYVAPARADPSAAASPLATLQAALAARGIEAMRIDVTRTTDAAVPVIKVLAPRLQLYPSTLVRPRLAAAQTAYAGANTWTQGIPLF